MVLETTSSLPVAWYESSLSKHKGADQRMAVNWRVEIRTHKFYNKIVQYEQIEHNIMYFFQFKIC